MLTVLACEKSSPSEENSQRAYAFHFGGAKELAVDS
jgi:hypothetical protein